MDSQLVTEYEIESAVGGYAIFPSAMQRCRLRMSDKQEALANLNAAGAAIAPSCVASNTVVQERIFITPPRFSTATSVSSYISIGCRQQGGRLLFRKQRKMMIMIMMIRIYDVRECDVPRNCFLSSSRATFDIFETVKW